MPRARTPRGALLAWYDRCARDLPWRRTRDPYAIWVSEVMLQQTRVDTVVGYYERFLTRFPTPKALARASEDEVMAEWSGLGYYRRARLLHAGVREVVAHYGGAVPEDPKLRRALPGIGRYTAGAIGSIAYGREEPIVDGNVARVLSRLHVIDTRLDAPETQRRLWKEAEQLVHGPRPGDLNQALMELGATLCNKQVPQCEACPVRSHCLAYAEGRASDLPLVRGKKRPKDVQLVALLATQGSSSNPTLWLARGEAKLFGGLWNLPMQEGRGHGAADALREAHGLVGRLAAKPVGEITHVLTHRRLQVQLWRVSGLRDTKTGLRAVPLRELGALGVSKLTHKALSAAGLVEEAHSLRHGVERTRSR